MAHATKTRTKEDTTKLRSLLNVLGEFRALDSEMQMQQAVTLLTIALTEGLTLNELTDRTQQASSSASRNVAALSSRNRNGKAGHGLVINKEDPVDIRKKLHHLTPKGETFVQRLVEMMP